MMDNVIIEEIGIRVTHTQVGPSRESGKATGWATCGSVLCARLSR